MNSRGGGLIGPIREILEAERPGGASEVNSSLCGGALIRVGRAESLLS